MFTEISNDINAIIVIVDTRRRAKKSFLRF